MVYFALYMHHGYAGKYEMILNKELFINNLIPE